MNKEIWKTVPGFENRYLVSNLGRVKTKNRKVRTCGRKRNWTTRLVKGKLLNLCKSKQYNRVSLGDNKFYLVHRFVALAFIPNPNNYPFINHIDGNKKNNYVENLEWCTAEQNNKHAWNTGLNDGQKTPVVASNENGFGYWYPSMQSTRFYGCNPSLVHNTISGLQKSHRGLKWYYADNQYIKRKLKERKTKWLTG